MGTGESGKLSELDPALLALLETILVESDGRFRTGVEPVPAVPNTETPDTIAEAKPALPDKPLAECTAAELVDLDEAQLAELLFRTSTLADRQTNLIVSIP